MRPSLTLTLAVLASPVLAPLASAAPPQVVTDIPPVHALVASVMGDLGTPVLLLDKGANAHSFQLRPSQAAALSRAGLLVWVGPEMTPWLSRALDGLGGDTPRLGLLAAEGTIRRNYGEDHDHGHAHDDHGHEHDDHGHAHDDHGHAHDDHGHAHDDHGHAHDGHGHEHDDHGHEHDDHGHAHDDHGHEHDDHGHAHDDHGHEHDDHGHAHDHGDHSHSGLDPHAWLEPQNALHWLGLIAGELAAQDPDNAAAYHANAAAAAERIRAADAEIGARLDGLADRPFIVFHDAYGYFSAHYGLNAAGSIALGDAATPGAARLTRTREMLVSQNIVCAFPEAQHDPRLVETVVEGTNVRIGATLDPSGSTLDFGPGLYVDLMTRLAEGIADCLGQDG